MYAPPSLVDLGNFSYLLWKQNVSEKLCRRTAPAKPENSHLHANRHGRFFIFVGLFALLIFISIRIVVARGLGEFPSAFLQSELVCLHPDTNSQTWTRYLFLSTSLLSRSIRSVVASGLGELSSSLLESHTRMFASWREWTWLILGFAHLFAMFLFVIIIMRLVVAGDVAFFTQEPNFTCANPHYFLPFLQLPTSFPHQSHTKATQPQKHISHQQRGRSNSGLDPISFLPIPAVAPPVKEKFLLTLNSVVKDVILTTRSTRWSVVIQAHQRPATRCQRPSEHRTGDLTSQKRTSPKVWSFHCLAPSLASTRKANQTEFCRYKCRPPLPTFPHHLLQAHIARNHQGASEKPVRLRGSPEDVCVRQGGACACASNNGIRREMAFDGRGQPNVGSVRHQRPRKWAIISLLELLVIIWEDNSLFIMFPHMSYIPTHVLHIPSRLSLFTSPEALIFPRSSTRRTDYRATFALSSATWNTSTSAVQINQWLKDQSLISYPQKIMPVIVAYRNKMARSRSTMFQPLPS